MPAQLEIVLIDSGESAQTVVDRATAPGRTPGPQAPQTGQTPDSRDGAPRTVFDSLLNLSRALGIGGMLTNVVSVSKAMLDLYLAVKQVSAAANAPKAGSASSAADAPKSRVVDSKVVPDQASQPKASGNGPKTDSPKAGGSSPQKPNDDYIDGEFEVKKPGQQPETDGPKATPQTKPSPANATGPPPPQPARNLPALSGPSAKPPALTGPPAVAPAANTGLTVARGVPAVAGAGASGVPAVAATAGLPAVPAATAPAAGAAAAGATSLLGPLAIVGAALIGAAAAVKVFDSVMHDQAEKLAGYSMELSKAQAQAEIASEMADIRRAERIGPQLANFESDRTRVMTALSDIGTSILQALLQMYEAHRPFIEGAIKSLELYSGFLELQTEIQQTILDVLMVNWAKIPGDLQDIAKATSKISRIMYDRENEDDTNDPFLASLLAGSNGRALREGEFQDFVRPAAPLGV